MKKLCLSTILAIIFLLLSFIPVEAHPIDQTFLDIYVKHTWEQTEIIENKMIGFWTVSWIQGMNAIGNETKPDAIVPDNFKDYTNELQVYFKTSVNFSNNGNNCNIENFKVVSNDTNEVSMNGLIMQFEIVCEHKIDFVEIQNSAFLDKAPGQTNYIYLYDGPDNILIQQQLNNSRKKFEFDLLPTETATTSTSVSSSQSSTSNSDTGSLPKSKTNQSIADKYIAPLGRLINENSFTSIIYVMLIIVFIGALHTMEAGHSKLILASMMIDNKVSMKQGFLYVVIFTVTHMADLIVLGLVLLIVNSFINLYDKLIYLQEFSNYALLGAGVVLFFKSLSELMHLKYIPHEHHHDHSHEHNDMNKTFKQQLTVAFITGLAPCLMGWVIFLLILASGKLWMLLPAVLAFGVGIFIALLVVMYLTIRIKTKVNKISYISQFSPIISAIILLIISISINFV